MTMLGRKKKKPVIEMNEEAEGIMKNGIPQPPRPPPGMRQEQQAQQQVQLVNYPLEILARMDEMNTTLKKIEEHLETMREEESEW